MRKKLLLAAAFIATVGLLVAVSTTAFAFPGVSEPVRCDNPGCHVIGTGAVNPVATLVSNDGVNATYTVSSGGLEWAIFNGATRIAGVPGSTGTFTVAVGGTYTLFAVQGFPGPLGITTVIPTPPANTFTITASAGANGTISPGTLTVDSGANATYTITPNSGFHIADVLVDNASVGAVGSFTFSNVTANHTIAASFAADTTSTFTIVPKAGAHGTITPATTQTVTLGSDATFTIKPAKGYHVAKVLVDGVSVGAVTSYTFRNVTANHTISATFAFTLLRTKLTINASQSSVRHGHSDYFFGSISPNQPNGTHIGFYVKKPGSHTWVRVSTRHTFAHHHWSYRYRLAARGSYHFQVRFAGTSRYAASTSRTIRVTSR